MFPTAFTGHVLPRNYRQFSDGVGPPSAPLSPTGEGIIRYNDTTKTFQVSIDGAAYVDVATGAGAGPWDITGTVVHLDVAGNTVAIGAAVMAATEKLRVLGSVRIEDDAAEGIDLVRAAATARSWRTAVGAGGGYSVRDLTGAVTRFDMSLTGTEFLVPEPNPLSFRVRTTPGGDDFLLVDTVAENMDFGNATLDPDFNFLGTGNTSWNTVARLFGSDGDFVVGAVAMSGTERFRVTGAATLFDGTAGATPVSGAGTRLMWVPAKAAFRVGRVSGGAWDDAVIGTDSMGIGRDSQAQDTDTVAIGFRARVDAGAASSIAIGEEARVFSGFGAIALGDAVEVRASESLATGCGSQTLLRGEHSHSAGKFTLAGDAQATTLIWRIQTTDGTANVEMFVDGGAGSERATLADDTSWDFEIQVVARKTNGVHVSMGFFTKGVIQRDTGAGTTALQGALISQVVNAAVGWTITIDADAVNGALRIRVTGAGGDNINWVATGRMTATTG